ncbi:MAG TPA: DUF4336 domain-containing protein [Myxococcaceae bacterium]|nr:DUF4336 domain-containing protein [Myxococcaceae bacterium]
MRASGPSPEVTDPGPSEGDRFLYHPLGRLKAIAEDLWWVDGPEIGMGVGPLSVPFPTRMVVARLASGDLWLWSPTPPTPALLAELAPLGRVAHLISPNRLHYAFIGQWRPHAPGAVAWASPGVRERARSQGISVVFDANLGDRSDAAWAATFDQVLYRSSGFLEEVVFFHRASRTLLIADLIQAMEPERMGWLLRVVTRLGGNRAPGGTPADIRWLAKRRRRAARAFYEQVQRWAPERLIVTHGRNTLENAGPVLERALGWMR